MAESARRARTHPRALPLAALALRRSRDALGWGAALFALWIAAGAKAPPGAALLSGDIAAARRAVARYEAWSLTLPWLAAWVVARGARLGRRPARGEAQWLLTRPIGRGRTACATWLGLALAACAWLALGAVAIELGAGGDGPALRASGVLSAGPLERLPDGGLRWALAGRARAGQLAALDLGVRFAAGGAPEVELELARPDGARRRARARLARAGTLMVEVPPGEGPLVVTLRGMAGGARPLVVGRDFWLFDPEGRERDGTLALFARGVLWLAAAGALALGLAAWLSAPTAFTAVAALWIVAWLSAAPPRWLPATDLWAALAQVAEGRAPGPPPLVSLAGAALLVAAGGLLARAGAAPGRGCP